MAAMEFLTQLIGCKKLNVSIEETLILEIEIFTRICEELKNFFKIQYTNYFLLMKFNLEMEDAMLEENMIRCVINDILTTEEYSLSGIAYYTQTSEDVILDLAIGRNTMPSLTLSRKIIDLHRSVKPHLYREIMKKISARYLHKETFETENYATFYK